MTDNRADLLLNLRHLLELDRDFGLEWVGKGGLTQARPGTSPPPVLSSVTTPVAALAPISAPALAAALSAAPALVAAPDSTLSPALAFAQLPDRPVAPVTAAEAPLLGESSLTAIAAEIARCTACGLCSTRSKTVPGAGHATAEIVFVGESPSVDDDAQGIPFVGADGDLLTRMIEAMGFARSSVFITNVIKCRPPGKRAADATEVKACVAFVHRQIAAIRPKVICTLGNQPLRALLGDDTLGLTKLRGQRLDYHGIPLIPTFHPDYLLRNPTAKKPCWEDLKAVLALLGRTPPRKPDTHTP